MACQENSHSDIFHRWFLTGQTLLPGKQARIKKDKPKHMMMLAEKTYTQGINFPVALRDVSDINHSVIVLKIKPIDIIIDYAK